MASGKPPGRSTVVEWLESPYLLRVASRVLYEYGLPPQDLPDLFQEIRLALWLAGPSTTVNATWVFRTAYHKASDTAARRRRESREIDRTTAGVRRDPDLSHLLRSRASRLPDRLRLFYSLRYREGLSQREIASRMGLCRGSVRWLDAQCLSLMKGRLRARAAG